MPAGRPRSGRQDVRDALRRRTLAHSPQTEQRRNEAPLDDRDDGKDDRREIRVKLRRTSRPPLEPTERGQGGGVRRQLDELKQPDRRRLPTADRPASEGEVQPVLDDEESRAISIEPRALPFEKGPAVGIEPSAGRQERANGQHMGDENREGQSQETAPIDSHTEANRAADRAIRGTARRHAAGGPAGLQPAPRSLAVFAAQSDGIAAR